MLSVYDTVVHDRRTVADNGLQAKLARLLDRLARAPVPAGARRHRGAPRTTSSIGSG